MQAKLEMEREGLKAKQRDLEQKMGAEDAIIHYTL